MEVAVAALPARHRIPGLGVHLHVEGEQVVTSLEAVVDRLVEEEPGLLALAEQPPLHVGEGADDGVDRPGLHVSGELVARQHPSFSSESTTAGESTPAAAP